MLSTIKLMIMNKKQLILGTIVIAAIAGGAYLTKNASVNKNLQYEANVLTVDNSEKNARWNDAKEHWEDLHRNVNTGEVEQADYDNARAQAVAMNGIKSGLMNFSEMGPDNVGGRTRAIDVDPTNPNVFYAGSVTGGLFKSMDGGNNWTKVDAWDAAVPVTVIGSLCVTNDGTLYVGTGMCVYNEPCLQNGEGIWYSTDGGASFEQVAGTENRSCYKLEKDQSQQNSFYYLSGSGNYLKRCENGSTTPNITSIGAGAGLSTTVSAGADVKVSPDGQHILYCGFTRVYVSNDGGDNFNEALGSSDIPGTSRIEGAVSHGKTSAGNYTMYVVLSSGGQWGGSWMSEDNGANWTEISAKYNVAANANIPLDQQFNPLNSGGSSAQGNYNLTCTVVPGDPYTMIFGGIDLYRWRKTPGSSPAYGQFERISFWYLPPNSPRYVHADNHVLKWAPGGRMLIGNDGGVGISIDTSMFIFTAANKGYNVTQYYAMAFGPDGEVMGGSQDNGSTYNNLWNPSGKSFTELTGGDGFECELSQLKSGPFISTVYYSDVNRGDVTSGVGGAQGIPAPCGTGEIGTSCGTFATFTRLFEDDADFDTQDSIRFIPDSNMFVGDVATYISSNLDLPLEYTLTQNLTVLFDSVTPAQDSVTATYDTILAGETYYYNPQPQDTVMLPNYIQAMLVTNTSTGVYVTRDVWNFSKTPAYSKVANVTNASKFEFSKDGNTLWIGTYSGQIWRVNGLDSAYVDAQFDIDSAGTAAYKLTVDQMTIGTSGQTITDISVDPNDPNKVAITAGGSGGNNVFYASNALSATPTFIVKDGNLPNYTVFACELLTSPGGNVTMIVGTEFGPYATDDNLAGTVSWTPVNQETGFVPVYDIRQQWRGWGDLASTESEGVKNPGEVYLGTYGRGIWKSDDVASTNNGDVDPTSIEDAITNITVYPNPMTNSGVVKFELTASSDVTIEMYSLQGKKVKNVSLRNIAAGEHNINFSAQDLAAGTYVVAVTSNGQRKITKFIVK
jgi:hypothetical protein